MPDNKNRYQVHVRTADLDREYPRDYAGDIQVGDHIAGASSRRIVGDDRVSISTLNVHVVTSIETEQFRATDGSIINTRRYVCSNFSFTVGDRGATLPPRLVKCGDPASLADETDTPVTYVDSTLAAGAITLWHLDAGPVATYLTNDSLYRVAIWSNGFSDDNRMETTFEVIRAGELIHRGQGPSGPATGQRVTIIEMMVSLFSFMEHEVERQILIERGRWLDSHVSLFPASSLAFNQFIAEYNDELSTLVMQYEA